MVEAYVISIGIFVAVVIVSLFCNIIQAILIRDYKWHLNFEKENAEFYRKYSDSVKAENEKLIILNTGLQEVIIEKTYDTVITEPEEETKKEHTKTNNNLFCPRCGSDNIYIQKNEPTHLECKCNNCNKVFKHY